MIDVERARRWALARPDAEGRIGLYLLHGEIGAAPDPDGRRTRADRGLDRDPPGLRAAGRSWDSRRRRRSADRVRCGLMPAPDRARSPPKASHRRRVLAAALAVGRGHPRAPALRPAGRRPRRQPRLRARDRLRRVPAHDRGPAERYFSFLRRSYAVVAPGGFAAATSPPRRSSPSPPGSCTGSREAGPLRPPAARRDPRRPVAARARGADPGVPRPRAARRRRSSRRCWCSSSRTSATRRP